MAKQIQLDGNPLKPVKPTSKSVYVTKQKYKTDEVVSALQKSIRRGNEEAAAYWAKELIDSELHWRLWKRLAVIAIEDCMDLNLFNGTCNAEARFYKWGTSNADSRLLAVSIAILMARAQKDRTADDMMCYFEQICEPEGHPKKPIPPEAIDCHTRGGREKGLIGDKASAHFFYEGSILKNESEHYNKKYSNALKQKYKSVWDEMNETHHNH